MIELKIFEGYYRIGERDIYRNNKKALYLFGDNVTQHNTDYVPYKTQAVIRGLENSFGISTKWNMTLGYNAYMSLKEYKKHIKEDMEELENKIKKGKYEVLYFPKDGIGTGLAIKLNPKITKEELEEFKTLAYNEVKKLVNKLNRNKK